MIVFICQLGFGADDAYRRAAPEPAFPNARVEDGRLVTRAGADDENSVGLIDPGNRRVEKIGCAAKLGVQFRAILAAVDVGRAELAQQRLEREHFFDRRQIADDCPDPGGSSGRNFSGDRGESLRPTRGPQPAVDTNKWTIKSLRLQAIDDVPCLVGDPFFVDRIVDPRQDAHDLATARIDPNRGAKRVHHVNRSVLAYSAAGMEGRRYRGPDANRTEVDKVPLQLRTQSFLKIGVISMSSPRPIAPSSGTPATSVTKRTHRVHCNNRFIEVLTSAPIYLSSTARCFRRSERNGGIGHGLILQIAFADLVADRAVGRMIDRQELHRALACLARHRRVRQHDRRFAVRAGAQILTAMAQEAIGLGGPPFTSTRHIRELPAIDSRSWKQKRGISAPATSQA